MYAVCLVSNPHEKFEGLVILKNKTAKNRIFDSFEIHIPQKYVCSIKDYSYIMIYRKQGKIRWAKFWWFLRSPQKFSHEFLAIGK